MFLARPVERPTFTSSTIKICRGESNGISIRQTSFDSSANSVCGHGVTTNDDREGVRRANDILHARGVVSVGRRADGNYTRVSVCREGL